MSLAQKIRVGLRSEVVILLPVTLILLVLLSVFTLFSYRGAVSLMVDDAQGQALSTAQRLTGLFSAPELPTTEDLRYLSPSVVHIVLVDSSGRTVFEKGAGTGTDLLQSLAGDDSEQSRVTGPSEPEGWITAIVPCVRSGQRHWLRVDLEASLLNRQLASLRILSRVVIAVNAALTVLVLLFLRHLLTPIDRLFERARQLLPDDKQVEDEVAFLVSSFERAIEAVSAQSGDSGADELAALERTLGPNLESGLLLVGLDAEVLALNPAGSAILGLEPPATPIPLDRLLRQAGELFGSVILEAIAEEKVIRRREAPFDKNGEQLTLGMSVNPLRRDDGTVRAYLVLFADLTETLRREVEEQMATSLEQVGELAAGVAHEMRNSLATFRGYLTLVERSPDDDSISDYLVELRREADHLQRVLEDFLSFARPESTRLEKIDLASIVQRTVSDPALSAHPFEISAQRAVITGDAQLLERALRNLLHNAAEASRANESNEPVEVTLETSAHSAVVTIADRGPGLSPEVQNSLFQPFATTKGSGVGLGLALAQRIVRLHAGRLTLENRPGGGARAILDLPLAVDATTHR